jgi:hypothetical protein
VLPAKDAASSTPDGTAGPTDVCDAKKGISYVCIGYVCIGYVC